MGAGWKGHDLWQLRRELNHSETLNVFIHQESRHALEKHHSGISKLEVYQSFLTCFKHKSNNNCLTKGFWIQRAPTPKVSLFCYTVEGWLSRHKNSRKWSEKTVHALSGRNKPLMAGAKTCWWRNSRGQAASVRGNGLYNVLGSGVFFRYAGWQMNYHCEMPPMCWWVVTPGRSLYVGKCGAQIKRELV